MSVISGGKIIEGLGAADAILNAGAPVNGVSEVQSLAITGTPSGGTFTLSYDGFTTAAIAYNATSGAVQTALQALPIVGTDITCSGGALPGTPVTITFGTNRASAAMSLITANGALLTGGASPAAAVTRTTTGVTATARGASTGGLLVDTTNGNLYQNSGTPVAPVWDAISGEKRAVVNLAGGVDTAGGLGNWQNPESGNIIIKKILIYVSTVASAACTLSAGSTAVNATTLSANLIDTLDVRTASGVFDNITDKGTNGKSRQLVAAGSWVTFSTQSGASAGLVAKAYIDYGIA